MPAAWCAQRLLNLPETCWINSNSWGAGGHVAGSRMSTLACSMGPSHGRSVSTVPVLAYDMICYWCRGGAEEGGQEAKGPHLEHQGLLAQHWT